MIKTPFQRASVIAVCVFCLGACILLLQGFIYRNQNSSAGRIALVISDGIEPSDPRVRVWADAAREEGILIEVVSISEYLRPSLKRIGQHYAGLILPDTVAQFASAPFIDHLKTYVESGGRLMLVYDAATHNSSGAYYRGQAPLSKVVGIDYALYDTLFDGATENGNVWGDPASLAAIGLPPGKSAAMPSMPPGIAPGAEAIVGYQYGPLRYSSYVTRGRFMGKRLLSSAAGGLVAGYQDHGKGGILFVNLPLGYLKGQTDGLLLHGFLHYFADAVLALPTLSAAPNGIGGLIFNWHVDSNAAIAPIDNLDKSGVLLGQGPFSIHFTVGPDARSFGDGLGMDLAKNPVMLEWIRRFKERGDAIGNHGGWIHDYFGLNVNEENRAEMEKYLVMNNQVLEAAYGSSIREYSAPIGKQPKWVTAWLEAHGYVSYYFTGNGGMGPTRSYREGQLLTSKIWSFPLLTFGKVASFEEAEENDISDEDMAVWLVRAADFVVEKGAIRMFYSHPPGFVRYPTAIRTWLRHTRTLLDRKNFSWYTMTQVGDFLDRREQVEWNVTEDGGGIFIKAEHSTDLAQLAWKLPKARYDKPVIEKGEAAIEQRTNYWLVTAGTGKFLRISCKFKKGATP
jgi:hypothetical protein